MTDSPTVPTREELMNPLLEALRALGGSASMEELDNGVAEIAGLTEVQLAVPHGDRGRSEVAYRLAWTRTYLKQYGLLENSSRGVWALTAAGRSVNSVEDRPIASCAQKAFSNLYGYASDEEGIRHSLIDDAASPAGQDEAVFMLGACASFSSFLWRKHRTGS